MNRKNLLLGLVFLTFGLGVPSAFSQKIEVHPYAGGFFPGTWEENLNVGSDGVYGVKAGWFVSDRLQLEGNLGYLNHFQFDRTSLKTRALVWDAGPSLNFFNSRFSRAVPYLSAGMGGVTGIVGDSMMMGADAANLAPAGVTPLLIESGDTFFQFSYGGGFKAINLWGPVGLRGDIRGRTLPNFFGDSLNWVETTAGITFTWGER
jgi:hypothetical protein